MNTLAGPLLLVGCGKMGTALLQGWIDHGLSGDQVVVVEPAVPPEGIVGCDRGVRVVPSVQDIPPDTPFRVVLFAIKPQMMAAVLPQYVDVVGTGTMVMSIAAGTSVGCFEDVFGRSTPVVRAMPNTPAAIGKGVTALFANGQVANDQRALAERLLAAVGAVHWVEDEDLMHVITAMSGGGPAYVFLLIETLAKAGIESGLSEKLAWPIARATVTGSAALAETSKEPVEILRQNVTSPGGTTLAALEVLMAADGIQPLFDRAIASATRRSDELAVAAKPK